MRRCETAAGLVGIAAWCVAYALISLVIWVTFAVPFGLLFALDALVGERAKPAMSVAPPAPPQRPVAMRPPTQLAA